MVAPGIGLRKRAAFLFLGTSLFLCFLIFRLATIQFWHGNKLRQEALDLRTRDVPVEPRRGVIYDRNLKELAISLNVDSVYAIPAQIKDVHATAALLAPILKMDAPSLADKLSKKEAFVWIKRKIEEDQSRQIRELMKNGKLRGIDMTQEGQRFYPNGTLASHILGFAGIDSQGLDGIELQYENELKGVPGKIVVEYDARGEEIPRAVHKYIQATPGNDLVLTIDANIQYFLEKQLQKVMDESKPKHASGIIMDPKTGEVLAMASFPNYDPNHFADYPQDNRRNWAISDTYNPGSIFKPVTSSAGLEEGVVHTTDTFYCGPEGFTVLGNTFHDLTVHGSETFYEILQNSCNIAHAQIAVNRLGLDRFYKYLDLFNITSKSGIDLPGEAKGIYPPRNKATLVDLGAMAFGQTLTTTPITMVNAITTIANGGVMMQPHLVREIRSPSGDLLKKIDPPVVRQVLSKQTTVDVIKGMEQVVIAGTAKSIYMEGYRFAGKTGTAQKVVDGRVSNAASVASFVGIAPANDPRVVMLVSIDEPSVGSSYGGVIAAPVFQAVMKDVYRYLDIPLQFDPARDKRPVVEVSTVPAVIGMTPDKAAAVVKATNLGVSFSGSGEAVVAQIPASGASVDKGTVVLLTLGQPPPPGSTDITTVPALKGLTMREAGDALTKAGLRLAAKGSGVVTNQTPPAGVQVKKGSTVEVQFGPR